MIEKIREFLKQLEFEPIIENLEKFKNNQKYIICGMGGSHLAGDLLKFIVPELDILICKNYSLPEIKDLNERNIITVSYSGNTEETINCFEEALSKNLNILVITKNGKLLELAKTNSVPYIKLPEDDIPPRLGVGYMLKSLLKISNIEINLEEIKKEINIHEIENKARKLSEELSNKPLLIYTIENLHPLAYFWKISFNENAKEIVFINEIPELCHNEIEMFEDEQKFKKIKFFVIFLICPDLTNNKNLKKVEILRKIFEELKIQNETIAFKGTNRFIIGIKNILFALFTSYYCALNKGIDPEITNLIERIKRESSF